MSMFNKITNITSLTKPENATHQSITFKLAELGSSQKEDIAVCLLFTPLTHTLLHYSHVS